MLMKIKESEMEASRKKLVLELVAFGLGVLLCILAIELIVASFYVEEPWTQSLFLSLGTGAAMSALVSWVFYIHDKLAKKREKIDARVAFMYDFKILYHDMINAMDFDERSSITINTEQYIKNQHRWYHEYYKRIVAGSDTEEETSARIKRMRSFMNAMKIKFCECFEYNLNWKNGDYSEWQYKEIIGFYASFKKTEEHIESQDYAVAFFEFSYFLERIKRMCVEFVELKNFNLLSFTYDSVGKVKINRDKFEEKESMFKFAREFNEIRRKNYREHYAEKLTEGNGAVTEESL